MKLAGYGLASQEKPGLLDAVVRVRDLSHHVSNLDGNQ
jgi:hypothetical protein